MQLDAGQRIARLRVDGGAAANDLLIQLQADLTGCEIDRPRELESTGRFLLTTPSNSYSPKMPTRSSTTVVSPSRCTSRRARTTTPRSLGTTRCNSQPIAFARCRTRTVRPFIPVVEPAMKRLSSINFWPGASGPTTCRTVRTCATSQVVLRSLRRLASARESSLSRTSLIMPS